MKEMRLVEQIFAIYAPVKKISAVYLLQVE